MNTKPRFGFAVEYVEDIDAATRFYTDVMGLQVERAAPTYVQFESFGITNEQRAVPGEGPELYWLVEDADTAYGEMSGQTKVAMPLTQMPFGRLFAVADPAGHARYVLELAQNRPSEAV
jgi:predicted enzyme related to lactoylglutathione lyase